MTDEPLTEGSLFEPALDVNEDGSPIARQIATQLENAIVEPPGAAPHVP